MQCLSDLIRKIRFVITLLQLLPEHTFFIPAMEGWLRLCRTVLHSCVVPRSSDHFHQLATASKQVSHVS